VQLRSDEVFSGVQTLSRLHGLTAYDAAYLDLAVNNGLPLATLDEDLLRVCSKTGVTLVHP